MPDEEKWWRRIDSQGSQHPYCLDFTDRCFYYRDYIPRGGYKRSETNQLVYNLKISAESIRENPNRKPYKKEAINRFADECSFFFDNLFSQIGELKTLLIPVPPSSTKTDPSFDDRLLQVAALLSKRYSSLIVSEALVAKETLQPSHLGGSRSIEAIRSMLQFQECSSFEPELIVVFDDVITSGAHYSACKDILSKRYPTVDIIGLFWAKSKPDVEYYLVSEI